MWQNLAWFLGGATTTAAAVFAYLRWQKSSGTKWIAYELQRFFSVKDASPLEVRKRSFPQHTAPDAKLGLDEWLRQDGVVWQAMGVAITNSFISEVSVASLLAPQSDEWHQPSSIDFESFDVGQEHPVECPRHAVWLIERGGVKLALLWTYSTQHSGGSFVTKLSFEAAYRIGDEGRALADGLFRHLEQAINAGRSYRGQILSLESDDDYRGNKGGITVHRLRAVPREDVVLPDSTVALLERNVVRFVQQRSVLARLGMPTKKGLLFYGPPGTGKTHTIHYLIGALGGHTTLLITAEQIGKLADYMALARLLQPCLVVIEDVDLIAQDRCRTDVCEQSLLNRLLNEMDGLRPDAAILFILTTNRPEALEAALAARPGRIDQAVAFPLPDARGRERLIELYAYGAKIAPDVVRDAVRLTEGVSASFIKELMRRAIQFHLECRPDVETPQILRNDVDQAIEEMLWSGGALNRSLLGAGGAPNGN